MNLPGLTQIGITVDDFFSLPILNYSELKGRYAHFNILFSPLNWLTQTSEMYFVKFHREVASCLLSRGKRKYAPRGWGYYENT